MKALVCSLLALLLSSFGNDDPKGIRTVVIDAGHGGKDPGCSGVTFKEKDISLAVALRLGKFIEDNYKDVKVIYTRKTDVFVELEDRAQLANKNKADLFISIHCNAAGKPVMIKDKKTGKMRPKTYVNKKGKRVPVETVNPDRFGSETYVMGLKNEEGKMKVAQRENSVIYLEDNYEKKYEGFDPDSEESYIIMSNYTSAYLLQSASLAMKIQDEYARKAGRVDKGVHRQSIWVLWRTAMPSILTEIGYLTNPLEEQFMSSEKGQHYIAASIFKGFRKYKDEVEGKKRDYNDELENMEALENENFRAGNTGKPKEDNEAEVEVEDSVKTISIEAPKKEDVKVEEKNKGEKKAEEEKQKKYAALVKQADEKLKARKYDEAEKLYTEAGTYAKENEIYVVQKLAEIEASRAEAAKKEAEENEKKPVTANDLVKNYNAAKKDSSKSAPTPTVAAKKENESKKEDGNKKEELKSGDRIEFRVQFAGSDKELDLKQSKYAVIEDAWYYKVGGTLKYTSGNFKTPEEAFKHQVRLKENGFKDAFVVAFKNGSRIDIFEAKRLIGK